MDKTVRKFFAAANGYRGFVSYFDKVFGSQDYDGVYVLKGGPGTGKSSFMRKLGERLADKIIELEEIYCSSDPHSLDGLIARSGGRNIAILDGTAPHERDAIIPGAIDTIINLGDNWDKNWLKANREKILKLSKEKTEAYKTAYFYLSLAGSSAKEIQRREGALYSLQKSVSRAKSLAESIAKRREGTVTTRLISSFGRYGLYGLNTLSEMSETLYSISGADTHCRMFLNQLKDALIGNCANLVLFPSPLSSDELDAIYLPDERIGITLKGGSEIINASEFVNDDSSVLGEQLRVAIKHKAEALNEAERWFAVASDIHFRIEEIYGEAMNFDKNDELFERYCSEMIKIIST